MYGSLNKRTFPKLSFCGEIAAKEKKRGVPDPGKYDTPGALGTDKGKNSNGMVKSTEDKYCIFIEDAVNKSKMMPRPGHVPANSQS